MCIALAGDGNMQGLWNFPKTVPTQTPKRGFRMHGSAVRSEPAQKLSDRRVGLLVRRQAILASEATPKSPKDEKRLVRSALSTHMPNTECLKLANKLVGSHEHRDRIKGRPRREHAKRRDRSPSRRIRTIFSCPPNCCRQLISFEFCASRSTDRTLQVLNQRQCSRQVVGH